MSGSALAEAKVEARRGCCGSAIPAVDSLMDAGKMEVDIHRLSLLQTAVLCIAARDMAVVDLTWIGFYIEPDVAKLKMTVRSGNASADETCEKLREFLEVAVLLSDIKIT